MKVKLYNNKYYPIITEEIKKVERRKRLYCHQINCYSHNETFTCADCIFYNALGEGIELDKLNII